jgi:hypothetical protein
VRIWKVVAEPTIFLERLNKTMETVSEISGNPAEFVSNSSLEFYRCTNLWAKKYKKGKSKVPVLN